MVNYGRGNLYAAPPTIELHDGQALCLSFMRSPSQQRGKQKIRSTTNTIHPWVETFERVRGTPWNRQYGQVQTPIGAGETMAMGCGP